MDIIISAVVINFIIEYLASFAIRHLVNFQKDRWFEVN